MNFKVLDIFWALVILEHPIFRAHLLVVACTHTTDGQLLGLGTPPTRPPEPAATASASWITSARSLAVHILSSNSPSSALAAGRAHKVFDALPVCPRWPFLFRSVTRIVVLLLLPAGQSRRHRRGPTSRRSSLAWCSACYQRTSTASASPLCAHYGAPRRGRRRRPCPNRCRCSRSWVTAPCITFLGASPSISLAARAEPTLVAAGSSRTVRRRLAWWIPCPTLQ